ncbi:hypothetical protein JQU17_05690 [Ponticoccus sp. SC2-23]|uniref:DUF6497 family protein n=1 Tax=Alexandriicola marinus TaxID=2081710 RepID=UPI000FD70AA1|nr:DUF6497 family protein [Alexandriicola marinus]MBM1219682.1 hypothetical protein [Ponticoccus sp. SC6-9]MBM1223246.1 hypothetical protein [Ponticoccus sp. SC6-15]MBM1229495.1 hypothetical protein [Ponticoccus sp. SC6-38]MBM1232212.1 hypothetical protein [Ponticoccus sp. SC6-45]MBM1241223.1 hypothetical protein [Ponticoccus sp. SC2-64]MBM1245736.1 hypothetical protein [Ponticoccus sp. SC6-42]MBM1250214.1 hypothetical protein [Ponticoccus sp. SC6-33]MBM1255847.1 hypothetical protein [Ponti
MRWLVPIFLLATPAAAQEIAVPSGLPLTFQEVILEPETGFARFRFVSDVLGQPGWELPDVTDDFAWLCDEVVLPALDQNGWEANQIVISMADSAFEFGEIMPDAVQYFEGYAIVDGACEWVPF